MTIIFSYFINFNLDIFRFTLLYFILKIESHVVDTTYPIHIVSREQFHPSLQWIDLESCFEYFLNIILFCVNKLCTDKKPCCHEQNTKNVDLKSLKDDYKLFFVHKLSDLGFVFGRNQLLILNIEIDTIKPELISSIIYYSYNPVSSNTYFKCTQIYLI